MRTDFINDTPVVIDPGSPSEISSSIEVSGLEGKIRDVNVSIDVDHTWTDDLEIFLVSPNGDRALLVGREGGSGDNFKDTTFDDAATTPIISSSPPFTGTFKPEESLLIFNDSNPNGTWTLHVEDKAFQDGGSLNSWTLSIDTGCYEFANDIPVEIDPGPPSTVSSSIEVTGLGGLVVEDITVTIDIDHTWDNDLTVSLTSPDGDRALLVDREGGNKDDFTGTVFNDNADISITEASPPFSGVFRPEGNLSKFAGKLADGVWTLEVRDNARHDGGSLNSWNLKIMVKNAQPPAESPFSIKVNFLGGLTANQRSVFELAAARWSEIISSELPSVNTDIGLVDDLVIDAEGIPIDQTGGTLGMAGPTSLRPGSLLPARGIMSFDTADLATMEADGRLISVIVHEMGHVLGIGTLWNFMDLIEGAGTDNPEFVGTNAMREYGILSGAGSSSRVPVANTGGPGTRDGHWRELVFGNELMTGFIGSSTTNPLSRMTIASLQDLGYEVNYDAADPFILPGASFLAAMGITEGLDYHECNVTSPEFDVLPED